VKVQTDTSAVLAAISTSAAQAAESSRRIKTTATLVTDLEKALAQMGVLNILANFLAVTGRVEAARAGEHGFAFAAVSHDIRELVEQSSDQLHAMGAAVRSIQECIEAVSAEVESAGVTVRAEIDRTTQTVAHMTRIDAELADAIREIEHIVREASDTLASVGGTKKRVESLSQGAQQISAACQQASAAADQQVKAMKVLASAAEEIAEQADEL
jgi:methyl-accepting chemotaxis protein